MSGTAVGYGGPVPALPNVIVIGAMKCATTAVHHYLDAHPDVSMTRVKEINFFNGAPIAPHGDRDTWWRTGQWHRGVDWYASLFDPGAPARGESSPGYTSPDHPEVAERMAETVPDVRLVYLVRDPVDRAVSQFRHHERDGSEARPLVSAVTDPHSHYVLRSRYHDRLQPFLKHFGFGQVHVVVQERLLRDVRGEMAAVYEHVGVDPGWRGDVLGRRFHVANSDDGCPQEVRTGVLRQVADDVERLRMLLDDDLPEWDA